MSLPSTTEASPLLIENLRSLARVDRELAQRIAYPVASAHVHERADGSVWYQLQRTLHRLDQTPGEVAASRASIEGALGAAGSDLFAFGLGLGETVVEMLTAHGELALTAWERDPWILRLALCRHDLSRALGSGRLRLLMGVDLIERLGAAPATRWDHPFLGRLYSLERRLLEGPAPTRYALLGLGTLFVQDVADALGDLGYAVVPTEFEGFSTEELDYTVRRLRPELVVRINHLHGLAEFCQARDLPLMIWEVDPATDRVREPGTTTASTFLFTYRRRHVETYREAGFQNVEHLPLATNTDLRRPLDPAELGTAGEPAPVAFVGSSMVHQARVLRARFLELCAQCPGAAGEASGERLQRLLDEQRADYSRYRVPELLEREFPELLHWAGETALRDRPEMLVGEVAAAEKRLSYVAALGALGVHVWGDDGWAAVEAHGARWRGSAGHRQELTGIYNSARVHVDIGRLYQMDIVTMRVFDVLACGGFLLAERGDELEDLFRVGEELEAYSTLAELIDKVRFYGRHPEIAQRIARRGCEAVAQRHTILERVAHMLAITTGQPRPAL